MRQWNAEAAQVNLVYLHLEHLGFEANASIYAALGELDVVDVHTYLPDLDLKTHRGWGLH